MNNVPHLEPKSFAVCSMQRCDRWSIYHRLQELNIACACSADGNLWIEVNHAIDLVLARSTVRQFLTSRQDDIDWLNRCWYTQELCFSSC